MLMAYSVALGSNLHRISLGGGKETTYTEVEPVVRPRMSSGEPLG